MQRMSDSQVNNYGVVSGKKISHVIGPRLDIIIDRPLHMEITSLMYKAVNNFSGSLYKQYGKSKSAMITDLTTRILEIPSESLILIKTEYYIGTSESFINLIIKINRDEIRKRNKKISQRNARSSSSIANGYSGI